MKAAIHPLELLRRGRWFAGLPDVLQREIVTASVEQAYERGEFIIKEGSPPRGMFAALEGRIHATRFVAEGREVLLHVLTEGVWFGDYGCYSGQRSIGSLVAASRAKVLCLPIAAFERIVADEPRHFRRFADLMLERYAVLFRYVTEVQGLSPEQVLALRLRDLATQWGDEPAHGPVEVNVTQAELASMIGVSRQTLSGFLARLASRGAIEIGFRTIRILDANLRIEATPIRQSL